MRPIDEQGLQLVRARPDPATERGDPDETVAIEAAERGARPRDERDPVVDEPLPPLGVARRAAPRLVPRGDLEAMLLQDHVAVLGDVDLDDAPEAGKVERPDLHRWVHLRPA